MSHTPPPPVFSIQLQTGRLVIPPEPEGGGHERGVGRQRGETSGHPQGEEQDQLPDALPGQVGTGQTGRERLERLPKRVPASRSALMSPKRAPTARPGRDRFTAESYTVLGKRSHPHEEHQTDPNDGSRAAFFSLKEGGDVITVLRFCR